MKRPESGTVSRETSARLAALAAEHELPDGAPQQFAALLALQAEDPTASTTVRDPALAVDRHVADSLSGLALDAVRGARRIADIGSGAGWPGLALAVALPAASVALVESASRHCRYLERAVEAAGLANASVVHARAEDWPAGIGAHDLVTARALAALPVLCEYAAPLLAEGGWLVAWKGAVSADELADGRAAAAALGLEPAEPLHVVPYTGARDHTLHAFCKIAPTPERFPRRAGMAVKRPLSADRPRVRGRGAERTSTAPGEERGCAQTSLGGTPEPPEATLSGESGAQRHLSAPRAAAK